MMPACRQSFVLWIGLFHSLGVATSALALPPPDDTPEEVLRTEIITEARSPVDGQLLTAAEYAELKAELEDAPGVQRTLPSDVRNIIYLLRIRRAIRSVFPFLLD